MDSDLAVVLVNYKKPDYTIESIDSLKKFPPSGATMEIIVVDNNSGDDSFLKISQAHPDVQMIQSPDNGGFAKGNNLALKKVRSSFVLLLNNDACVEEGLLDGLMDFLRKTPSAAAASPRVVNATDGESQDFPENFPTIPAMMRRFFCGAEFPADGKSAPVPMPRLHGCCMMMKGEALAAVGLLDEGYFMYDEDVDWCVRARAVGWTLWLLPSVQVRHYGGATSERSPTGERLKKVASPGSVRMQFELRRSRYRLYRKFRAKTETVALKFLTDAACFLSMAFLALRWLRHKGDRQNIEVIWRGTLRIIGINPFSRSVYFKGDSNLDLPSS